MAKKDKPNKLSSADLMSHLRKCEFCRGKDNKKKDVYETVQSAFDTAKHIEEERGIYLNIYQCPHGNGWHLTKNDTSLDIIERKDTIFRDNNIPLASSDGSWEYIKDDFEEEKQNKVITEPKRTNKQSIPISKVMCKSEKNITGLSGKIMEIIENVNIEKILGINLQNAFCANMIKNVLDGVVNQITIYVEDKEKNQFNSYTILIKKDLQKNKKFKKGEIIKLDIVGKSINKIKMWCCSRVLN